MNEILSNFGCWYFVVIGTLFFFWCLIWKKAQVWEWKTIVHLHKDTFTTMGVHLELKLFSFLHENKLGASSHVNVFRKLVNFWAGKDFFYPVSHNYFSSGSFSNLSSNNGRWMPSSWGKSENTVKLSSAIVSLAINKSVFSKSFLKIKKYIKTIFVK